jgi:hypothetical protein
MGDTGQPKAGFFCALRGLHPAFLQIVPESLALDGRSCVASIDSATSGHLGQLGKKYFSNTYHLIDCVEKWVGTLPACGQLDRDFSTPFCLAP